MIENAKRWILKILDIVWDPDDAEFTGLGVLFYLDRAILPVRPLINSAPEDLLPARGASACADVLKSISRRESPFHDGFHLICLRTLTLTDLSQFVSPPLLRHREIETHSPGARHMAAALSSCLPEIPLAIICAMDGKTLSYQCGKAKILRR